jgi:hypothetical protein
MPSCFEIDGCPSRRSLVLQGACAVFSATVTCLIRWGQRTTVLVQSYAHQIPAWPA